METYLMEIQFILKNGHDLTVKDLSADREFAEFARLVMTGQYGEIIVGDSEAIRAVDISSMILLNSKRVRVGAGRLRELSEETY